METQSMKEQKTVYDFYKDNLCHPISQEYLYAFLATEMCYIGAIAFKYAHGLFGKKATIETCLDILSFHDEWQNESLQCALFIARFLDYHFKQKIDVDAPAPKTGAHYDEWLWIYAEEEVKRLEKLATEKRKEDKNES